MSNEFILYLTLLQFIYDWRAVTCKHSRQTANLSLRRQQLMKEKYTTNDPPTENKISSPICILAGSNDVINEKIAFKWFDWQILFKWHHQSKMPPLSVADPDFELRRGPSSILLAQRAYLPFSKNKGGGASGPLPWICHCLFGFDRQLNE